MRRTRLSLAATVAASLLLAGCGGSSSEGPGSKDGDSTDSTKPAAVATWPLTGEKVPDGKSAESPAYIVKIDNTAASNPQVGLGRADLIVEELVEGGITRLAAMFQSQLPRKVGPVRSMRLTDIGIAKPLGAEIVTSGAAEVTLRGLAKAGVKFADMNNPAVIRVLDGSHDSLHSVMADLVKLSRQKKQHSRPVDYLPWGKASDFPGGRAATKIDARMSAARTAHWTFAGGKYHLDNSYMPSADSFAADTVIVCMVRTSVASYVDPAGNPVPISHFEGTGDAVIFHGGKAVRGTWTKSQVGTTVTFATKTGSLTIPAGHTWLHLVPTNGGSISFR